tara:strand:+ start:1697 stop:2449 length:753 start_codon:yes stop_codon:yes gene_type:complete
MKLSSLIIARNEETNIENCLKSLYFVDEIIVILDRSEDNTEKIVKKYTNKIFKGSWFCEAERRNFGLKKCKSDWILEVDADEIITEKLSNEISRCISKKKYDFFYISLLNFVGKNSIRFGWMACMAPEGKFCLFKNGKKNWIEGSVHPSYSIEGKKGPILSNPILHYMSKNISDLIKRFNRNTSLYSIDLKNKKSLNKYLSLRKIFSRFIKCYISRSGYKSGKIGFLISILSAIYPYVSAKKAQSDEIEI